MTEPRTGPEFLKLVRGRLQRGYRFHGRQAINVRQARRDVLDLLQEVGLLNARIGELEIERERLRAGGKP